MPNDPIFTRLNLFDAPEPPNLKPALAERAVLFEVIRVTPNGRPLATAPTAPQPSSLSNTALLALVGLVSGSTGAMASASGIALGLVLATVLPQLSPVTADVHTVTATAPQVVALSAGQHEQVVASKVDVEHSTTMKRATSRTSPEAGASTPTASVSIAEAMPHLRATAGTDSAEPAQEEAPKVASSTRKHADATPSTERRTPAATPKDSSKTSVWSAPPPKFASTLPEPPPPLRLAASAPVTRAPASSADRSERVKLVDRLGLRKRR